MHLSPGRVDLPGAPSAPSARLRLTVACGPAPAAGAVEIDVPPGLAVDAAPASLDYKLSGGEHACWDLTVRALPGAAPGRHFVAARIGDDLGQVLEDAAQVSVGEPAPAPLDAPLEEVLRSIEAGQRATAAEADLTVLTPSLALRPGGRGEIAVALANRAASRIRGEAQLISPFGSWDAARPWTRGFSAAPGQTVTVRYTVTAPPSARPGEHWWALVKVMYFGRVRYTRSIPVTVAP